MANNGWLAGQIALISPLASRRSANYWAGVTGRPTPGGPPGRSKSSRRLRRLTGVDDVVISLSAKGLTHGEIAAHWPGCTGAEVPEQTITTITGRVMEGMAEWQNRILDPVYAVIFIDAI